MEKWGGGGGTKTKTIRGGEEEGIGRFDFSDGINGGEVVVTTTVLGPPPPRTPQRIVSLFADVISPVLPTSAHRFVVHVAEEEEESGGEDLMMMGRRRRSLITDVHTNNDAADDDDPIGTALASSSDSLFLSCDEGDASGDGDVDNAALETSCWEPILTAASAAVSAKISEGQEEGEEGGEEEEEEKGGGRRLVGVPVGGVKSASRVTLPLHSSGGSNSSPYLTGGIVGVAVERREHDSSSSSLVRRLFTENSTSTATAAATSTADTETTPRSSESSGVVVFSLQPSRIPSVFSSLSSLASPRRHARSHVTMTEGIVAEEVGAAVTVSSPTTTTSTSDAISLTRSISLATIPIAATTTTTTVTPSASRRRLFTSPTAAALISSPTSALRPPRPPFSSPERTAIHEAARVESASAAKRVASRLAKQRLRATNTLLKNNVVAVTSPTTTAPTTVTSAITQITTSRAAARASTRASWLFSSPAVSFEPLTTITSTTTSSPPTPQLPILASHQLVVPVAVEMVSQNASKTTTFEFFKGPSNTTTPSPLPQLASRVFTTTTPLSPSRSPNDNLSSPATDPMIVSITTPTATSNSPPHHHHHVSKVAMPPRAIAYIF